MPNPKVGTVTFDVGGLSRNPSRARWSYRVEKAGIVHAPVGKVSFPMEKLKENILLWSMPL